MRKSQAVPLTLLAAAALAASTGCDDRPREVRNCVDSQNHIVPDDRCDHPSLYLGSYGNMSYRYLYGGASGGRMGDTVVGGNADAEPGAVVYSGEKGISRGGFGGFFGGGGEGEGGHGGGE